MLACLKRLKKLIYNASGNVTLWQTLPPAQVHCTALALDSDTRFECASTSNNNNKSKSKSKSKNKNKQHTLR